MTQEALQYASQQNLRIRVEDDSGIRNSDWEQAVCSGQWIHLGNTDDCDVVVRSLPEGLIALRALVLGCFFLVESADRVELNFLEFVFETVDHVVTVSSGLDPDHFLLETAPDLQDLRRLLDHPSSVAFYQALLMHRGPLKGSIWPERAARAPSSEVMECLQIAYKDHLNLEQAEESFWFLNLKWWFLYWSAHGFGLLQPLLDLDGVKEILVNGVEEIYVDLPSGLKRISMQFPNQSHLNRFVASLCEQMDRRLDCSSPTAQGMVLGRFRVHIVSSEVVPKGPAVSIRCFPQGGVSIASFCSSPSPSEQARLLDVLQSLVASRKNILISGETSSGKSSLLEALSQWFMPSERVIVAEDVRELRLRNSHCVYMQTQTEMGTVSTAVGLRSLVKEALRMRPDRIVVGECRGPEALDLLQALNTGHAGSLATIHGSSPHAALHRLVTLAQFGQADVGRETLESLIMDGIDCVIQMSRTRDGGRFVESICQMRVAGGGVSPRVIDLEFLFTSGDLRADEKDRDVFGV